MAVGQEGKKAMKALFIGTYRKYGNYTPEGKTESFPYDNTFLYFGKLTPEPETAKDGNSTVCDSCGFTPIPVVKVKTSALLGLFDSEQVSNVSELLTFVGSECKIFFDENKHLDSVIFK